MRLRLLQAREADEATAAEERDAFCARLGLPPSMVQQHDVLHQETTFARITDGVDAVLVGGSGRFGINDDAPWIPGFIDVLGALADAEFPTFASCFGFQALCVALGQAVESNPARAEVGTYELQLTAAGAADPLFSGLPKHFSAQEGHKDSAMAPPIGATCLAQSLRCPVQAIRVGDGPVYATQFHPELSHDDQRLRFLRYYDLYCGIYGRDRTQQILDSICPSPHANDLLPRFIDLYVRS
jgi:GMP synthase (glutamine-hydrolysing)